jgi:hypothetical protein
MIYRDWWWGLWVRWGRYGMGRGKEGERDGVGVMPFLNTCEGR